ncbi:response regulator [Pelagicoccus sp. SDUM812003]|uniref:response regulator n=1 Tax=Pelagicoccus sp. SDUM812003 TaxID=3041267 RepID=UPI00280CB4D7|nr:response regulator [Pelagicoccus sp. SDUM812003]MDQ8204707.1 response regulator [Pelagicoccus sp. SDUM812003]
MNKVLVVDDSLTARNYHRSILQSAGFTVGTAEDGAQGLELLFKTPYDVILTDINMIGMNGYDFIRRVRAEEEYQEIPIAIISTEKEDEDMRLGYEAGANVYITKPCNPMTLLENVKMLGR